ncbi:MAG: hypothetical protein ACKOEC_03105 [Acidimicrobiia bacterium]
MLNELRHRDPLLFWVGAANLLVLVVCALLSIGDQRLVLGINVWIKPIKFLVSVAMFVWTIAWFAPETTSPRLQTSISRVIAVMMSFEIVSIVAQAARGTTSHYNNSTPLDGVVFALMGIAIMIVTVAVGVFLAIVRRDTPPHRAGYLWGMRAGLFIFLLACLQGGILVANNAHNYKAEDLDFTLKAGSLAIDRGVELSNVTDGFTGKAPDLGALEVGRPPIVYGPRK